MKPRHLFIKKMTEPNDDHWLVSIGNISVGAIRKTSMYNFVPNRGWLPNITRLCATTMEAMKLRLIEEIDSATYQDILDKAYKQNGYKG